MLNYKKPAFWIIIAAIAACAVVAVCFLTNPKATEPDLSFMNYENACSLVADVTDVDTVYYPPTKKDEDGQISIGYVNGNDLAKYLDLVSWQKCKAPQEGLPSPGSIVFYIEDGYRIAVYQKPHRAMVTYGDEVRYYKTHGGDYDNAIKLFRKWSLNSAAMKWFDSLHGDEMIWDGNRQSTLNEFPDVTFHWSSEKVEAVTDKETITLYTGMPIWSVYFCDLNGDGKPEVCSSISLGSGMIDNRIIVADYANKAVYELSDRGHYDYILTCQNGQLLAEKRAYMQDEVLEAGRLVLRSVIGTGGASIPMLMIEQSELQNRTGTDIASDGSTAAIDALREQYPEYFDLPTGKGLEVYVWQMAQNSYSFGVLSGTNRYKSPEELWNLKGVSAEEMKAILSTYDIDEQNIYIYPWQNPISSYIAEYWITQEGEEQSFVEARRQAYVDNIRSMLFD